MSGMAELMKYVILSDGTNEYAVVFDRKLSHVDVAHGIIHKSWGSRWSKVLGPLNAVAAGFIGVPEMRVDQHLGSESLELGPRPQDGAVIRGEPFTATASTAATVPPKRTPWERAKSAKSRP